MTTIYFFVISYHFIVPSCFQEHHLQRALTAQQAYGTAEALAIPVPEMDSVGDRFLKLYGQRSGFKVTKQYIHVQRKFF